MASSENELSIHHLPHNHAQIRNSQLLQTIQERPLKLTQNVDLLVIFCAALLSLVIWATQREQRLKYVWGGGSQTERRRLRTESNMSGSMDDNSNGSQRHHRQPQRPIASSQEFLLSPALLSRSRSAETAMRGELRSQLYSSLNWAAEDSIMVDRIEDAYDNGAESSFHHYRRSELIHPSYNPNLQQLQQEEPTTTRRQPVSQLSMATATSATPDGTRRRPRQQQFESAVIRHGPHVSSMVYNTWTPPPSWAEAARRVFPRDVKTLHRTLKINLLGQPHPTLTIGTTATDHRNQHYNRRKAAEEEKHVDFCLTVTEFSVHPTPPTEGVLEVYVKNSPKSEWMEHTFQSAQAAAQFQTDLLAAQLLGPTIRHMYTVFRLIHQGSLAFDGPECLLRDGHDAGEAKDHVTAVGVAWDDVMRCFGSTFPRMRMQLEELWWHETKPKPVLPKTSSFLDLENTGTATTTQQQPSQQQPTNGQGGGATPDNGASAENGADTVSEYTDKRVLLGPVDFFRLFIPALPADALPYTTSDVRRMEQMLLWRKRVARASFLLQTYARARQLVNVGWQLGESPNQKLPEKYLKYRLSYDMNLDNQARDKVSTAECYEPYVSRDVFCRMRGVNHPRRQWWNSVFTRPNRGESVMSLGQAFSLVGVHIFRLEKSKNRNDSENGVIDPKVDLVQALPSLRKLIVEENCDAEFFVKSVFNKNLGIVVIAVFVRSIPVGVDPSFDLAWQRFCAGDAAYRKRRTEIHISLALATFTFPVLQFLFLKLFSFLIWLVDPVGYVGQSNTSGLYAATDRYTLPPLLSEDYGRTFHFGGGVQKSADREATAATNYVSINLVVDSQRWTSLAGRMLMTFVTSNQLQSEIADVSVKIRARDDDELPERILGVFRLVKTPFYKCALPAHVAVGSINSKITLAARSDEEIPTATQAALLGLFWDPVVAAARACGEILTRRKQEENEEEEQKASARASSSSRASGSKPSMIASNDPIEKAVNKLIELLEDVSIPIRKANSAAQQGQPLISNSGRSNRSATPAPFSTSDAAAGRDLQQVPILRVVSRNDLRRFFVASNSSLKKATVRVIESAAWRGLTFPVDLRTCRVELQTGQFFQKGKDLGGHPIFYYRHMCKGPWPGSVDSSIAAVVHRLEQSLVEFTKEDPDVRCTLIVLLGRPRRKKKKRKKKAQSENGEAAGDGKDEAPPNNHESSDDDDGDGDESDEEGTDDEDELSDEAILRKFDNPRVPRSEKFFAHTSEHLVARLVQLLLLHYPERLYRTFVVKGHGGEQHPNTLLACKMALSGLIDSSNTRRKVRFYRKVADLRRHVDRAELIQLAGGDAPIPPSAFDVN